MTTRTKIILEGEDRTAAAFRSVKSNLGGIGSAASTANRMLAGLGVGLSVGAIAAFISKGVNAAAAMADLSTRTGVAVRELAGLQVVAKLSDTSIETLGKSINKLGVFMAENSGAAQQLGLTAKEPLQAFIQLSGILSQIPDVQLRNATANKVLGKSYEELLPALLQGPEALRRQIEQGQRYNGITQEMAEEAKKFKDQLDLLKISTEQLGVSAANNLLPALNDITSAMVEAQKEGSLLKTLWVGLGGLGAFLFTDEFASAEKKIYNIGIEIKTLERRKKEISGGGLLNKLLFGTEEQIDEKITALRKQIEQLKSTVDSPPLPAPAPKQDSAVAQAACAAIGGVYRNGKCETEKNTGADARLKASADYVKGLQEQVAMLGLSKEAAELYKASLMGLSSIQMESVRASLAQISAYEEGIQHLKDGIELEESAARAAEKLLQEENALTQSLKDKAESLKEQLDPQYALNKALKLYGEQLEKNGITQEEYNVLFDDSIARMIESTKSATGEMSEFSRQAARNMQDAFADFLFDPFSKGLKGMVAGFLDSLRRMTAEAAAARIFESLGGNDLVGSFFGLFNAKGNAFNASGVMPFARGGIVNSPTMFPFANGVGLMGEAGPEAIMPLRRGADGRLGVEAAGDAGAGAVTVVLNISTGVSQTVRAEIANMMPVIKREVMSAVADAKKRGGSFGSTFD